jgi:hypothetical protein
LGLCTIGTGGIALISNVALLIEKKRLNCQVGANMHKNGLPPYKELVFPSIAPK